MAEGILTKGGRAGGDAAADGGWRGLLPDILLICINGVGIAGALLEALGVKWGGEINQPLFWGGLFIICALSVLWWRGKKKGIIWRTAALCLAYGAGAVWMWETVIVRLWRSLPNGAVDYGELSFEYAGELMQMFLENSGNGADIRALGFLGALFPFAMLTGFLCSRGRWQILLIWNIVWIAAACDSNLFPRTFFLILCVAGIALETARGEFRDNAGVWAQAAAVILGVALLGIWAAGALLLPALNAQYGRSIELRHSFYVTVNHKVIPSLQEWINDYGSIGRGVDVTGAIGRQRYRNRTAAGIYRVTLDEKPGQTLYLRGFVGADYSRRQWEPEDEEAMERYDRENDFSLAQDAAGLLNIGYRAMENRGQQAKIRIEELAGRGSYSLLPYGALVTDSFTAHTGGTVDRRGRSYDFQYRQLSGAAGGGVKERWELLEQMYRGYVYDNFLDYPRERLPRLTEALEAEGLPEGDPYLCAKAVIRFLEVHAGYRLDAPAAPLGKDSVEYFLFDSHEGYCAHFASAAVLMFRYCGIPARYATGYSASSQRFAEVEGGLYTAVLTGAQAHAWAEIYVDGVGWVPIEATPGAEAFAEDNRMELLARLGELTGDVEPQGEQGFSEGDEEDDEDDEETGLPGLIHELEDDLDEEEEEENANGEAWALGPAEIAICLLVTVILAAAAAVCTAFFRRRRWKKKLKETEGREKVFLLYRNMRRALWVLGCSGKLLLTGEAFWNRLQTVLPTQEKKDYDMICAILEQSSFGRRELDQKEVAAMGGLHDEMLRKLYFKAPSYKRAAFWGLICCMPPEFGYGQGK